PHKCCSFFVPHKNYRFTASIYTDVYQQWKSLQLDTTVVPNWIFHTSSNQWVFLLPQPSSSPPPQPPPLTIYDQIGALGFSVKKGTIDRFMARARRRSDHALTLV